MAQDERAQQIADAVRRHGAGDLAGAIAAYRALLAGGPGEASLHYNLGAALQATGAVGEAIEAYEKALALDQRFVAAHYNLGVLREERGELTEALGHFSRAAELEPGFAAAHNNRGGVLVDLGRVEDGVAAFRRAIACDPRLFLAHWNLGKYGFDGANVAETAEHLGRAVAIEPRVGALRCHHAMALALAGREDAAKGEFAEARRLDPEQDAAEDGFAYLRAAPGRPRLFGAASALLAHAAGAAAGEGLWLEFGVFRGNSINQIARRATGIVHGFDSFEGLPADWGGGRAKGSYSTGGALPMVEANVRLHTGLFEDTLPRFAVAHEGRVAFAHIDCDLYQSTRAVFHHLGARMGPGTVLVFDEYLGYRGWREHEWRAFHEFIAARGLRYEYLAFTVFGKQAAVRIA
ncbi:MAG: protein arginine N-methyltransferase [Alphaproteobacteria bacterium]